MKWWELKSFSLFWILNIRLSVNILKATKVTRMGKGEEVGLNFNNHFMRVSYKLSWTGGKKTFLSFSHSFNFFRLFFTFDRKWSINANSRTFDVFFFLPVIFIFIREKKNFSSFFFLFLFFIICFSYFFCFLISFFFFVCLFIHSIPPSNSFVDLKTQHPPPPPPPSF